MGVFPGASSEFLPSSWQKLMLDEVTQHWCAHYLNVHYMCWESGNLYARMQTMHILLICLSTYNSRNLPSLIFSIRPDFKIDLNGKANLPGKVWLCCHLLMRRDY